MSSQVFNFVVVASIFAFRTYLDAFLAAFDLVFGLLYKQTKDPHFLVSLWVEVEPKFLAKPELEQVVIKTLLANAHQASCLVETHPPPLGSVIRRNHKSFYLGLIDGLSVVKVSPGADFVDDICDGALFSPFSFWLLPFVADFPGLHLGFRLSLFFSCFRRCFFFFCFWLRWYLKNFFAFLFNRFLPQTLLR